MKIFYNGLNYSIRALIDVTCGGSITMKTTRETNLIFEELMVENKRESMKLIEYNLWRQNLKL